MPTASSCSRTQTAEIGTRNRQPRLLGNQAAYQTYMEGARELVGRAALLPEGVTMLARRGTFVNVGLWYLGPVAFDPSLVLRMDRRVVGSAAYPHEL